MLSEASSTELFCASSPGGAAAPPRAPKRASGTCAGGAFSVGEGVQRGGGPPGENAQETA
eukprot:14021722-Alexandrium_andersonii.AAC.1